MKIRVIRAIRVRLPLTGGDSLWRRTQAGPETDALTNSAATYIWFIFPTKSIQMKKVFASLLALMGVSFTAWSQPQSASGFNVMNKRVTVYTTADSSKLRLSLSQSKLKFADFGQPLETQVCIFVDPNRTFQTFLGIGGALTDAAAETFAKLPKDKQQQILDAYYNSDKGIGFRYFPRVAL